MNVFVNYHLRRTDPKISRGVRQKIVQALREGKSNAWIIENIGTCRTTITRLVREFKIVRSHPKNRYRGKYE